MLWQSFGRWGALPSAGMSAGTITGVAAGTTDIQDNANATPTNPPHSAGNTLLAICFIRNSGGGGALSCATSGWTDADGITNPVAFGGSRMWLFQNECDSSGEANPVIATAGGAAGDTVIATVINFPGRDFAKNFSLGTVSSNGSNNTDIAFAQNSPSIGVGDAIVAIGMKDNDWSATPPALISGMTAGLTWAELVNTKSILGNDSTHVIDYAINNSGSSYTAGTSGIITMALSVGAPSAGAYLKVPA